jgi:hypothetical protein
MLNSKLFVGVSFLLSIATGCGRSPDSGAEKTSFVSQDETLDAFVYLYSEKSGSGEGKCWYKVTSGKELSPEKLSATHS